MNDDQIDDLLRRTMADFRISRGEKKIISALAGEVASDEHRRGFVRHRAFEMARNELITPHAKDIVNWLEDLNKSLQAPVSNKTPEVEVFFSPGDDCMRCVVGQLRRARRQVDICVFTITDNRITDAIEESHQRGVLVRVISDNDKSEDRGSDVDRLLRNGLPVRVDVSDHHMHHKFAVFDGQRALTGSYNWTRSATEYNEENLMLTSDHRAVRAFSTKFASLWKELS